MARSRLFHIRRHVAPGASPGTMIAPLASLPSTIAVLAYDGNAMTEVEIVSVADIPAIRQQYAVTWVDVAGLGDASLIGELGQQFGLHRLAMEDVLNLHQRPKVEEFDSYLFLVTRMLLNGEGLDSEQFSMFLGPDFVLSFQERPDDCLGPLRERIRRGKGRIRIGGADYLAYALLDAVIDEYFPILEHYGEALESLEAEVIDRPEPGHIADLHDMKRALLTLRRAIWPHREMINSVIRDENELVSAETRVYLRDTYDHTIQLIDIVETYREIASGLVDVYISSVSAKLNEIMKVLTVIATIFIPLGFVASLYGMNFDRRVSPWNMPELGWRFGYPLALLGMLLMAVGMLLYFRRNGWLGERIRKRGRKRAD